MCFDFHCAFHSSCSNHRPLEAAAANPCCCWLKMPEPLRRKSRRRKSMAVGSSCRKALQSRNFLKKIPKQKTRMDQHRDERLERELNNMFKNFSFISNTLEKLRRLLRANDSWINQTRHPYSREKAVQMCRAEDVAGKWYKNSKCLHLMIVSDVHTCTVKQILKQ